MDPAIESHYGAGYERSRLFPGGSRRWNLSGRWSCWSGCCPPPARILDVGGGPGAYAAPLARRGYQVHLVDPVPLHVRQAQQAAAAHPAAAFTAAGAALG
jgi:2-polyprenyl-3-methyl-5-hydroxy-6-metoxy-1,4-benzoquinol methylase